MPRILVVDDEPFSRGYISQVLRQAGYDVEEAPDGREAVRMVGEGAPDLIVLDLFMPRGSGLDVLLEVRPRESGIPVVVISGGSFGTVSEPTLLASALGAVRFLQKPFRKEALLAVVASAVESSSRDRPGLGSP